MLHKHALPFLLTIALSSGLSSPARAKNGPSDGGGGGNLVRSTKEEVRAAISNLLLNLLNPKSEDPVGLLTFLDAENENEKRAIEVIEWIVRPYTNEEFERRKKSGEKVYEHWREYFALSPVKFLESSGCKGISGHLDTEASVSAMKHGATLCFSLKKLQGTPKQELETVLIPLVLHEMAHLNGFGEKDARIVQEFAMKHAKAGELMRRQSELIHLFGHVSTAFMTLEKLSEERVSETSDPRRFFLALGSIDAELGMLNEALYVDIYFDRPELEEETRRRIEELRRMIRSATCSTLGRFHASLVDFENELLHPLTGVTNRGIKRNPPKCE